MTYARLSHALCFHLSHQKCIPTLLFSKVANNFTPCIIVYICLAQARPHLRFSRNMITPSKKNFLELVKNGRIPPLSEEIPYLSPSSLYESLASPNSFLLESMKGPMKIARYSFIGLDPYAVFRVKIGR